VVTFEDGDNRAMATDRTDVMLRVFAAINRRDFGQQAVGYLNEAVLKAA
jgi:hypothetical protein